jgi:glycerophosphoryl diester phosphodiesterase
VRKGQAALSTTVPIVIAHRGASGYLPEHTLIAKALAYGLGADFLEQDVVASRDGHLLVLHDLHLDDVSDVAKHFPGRHRDDGHYYVIDFDLTELRRLTLFERRKPGQTEPRFPGRFPHASGLAPIVTLNEELTFVAGLNRSTGRAVGVYPEIKHPRWHAEHGIDLAKRLLETLTTFGYTTAESPAFVQCFDAAELRRVRDDLGSRLRLIQLVGTESEYTSLLQKANLHEVASYADGLGPHHSQLVDERREVLPLARWAADAGLALHPYTFRADDLPGYARNLDEMLEIFFERVGVDGVFSDHPDIAVRVRGRVPRRKK